MSASFVDSCSAVAGGEQHRGAPELGRPGGAVPPARHTAAGGHSVQPGRRSLLR